MKKPTTFEEAEAYTKALFAKDHRPFVMSPDFWLNSQLSVAKYYGGCDYNGVKYVIVPSTCDMVRFDCLDIYHKFYKKTVPIIAKRENSYLKNRAITKYYQLFIV